jgi:hypothetical protein
MEPNINDPTRILSLSAIVFLSTETRNAFWMAKRDIYNSISFGFLLATYKESGTATRALDSLFIEGVTFRAHVNENFIKTSSFCSPTTAQGVPGILKLQAETLLLNYLM